jgi:hypothetical protein
LQTEKRKERRKDNFGNCKGTKQQTNNFLAGSKTKFSGYKGFVGDGFAAISG